MSRKQKEQQAVQRDQPGWDNIKLEAENTQLRADNARLLGERDGLIESLEVLRLVTREKEDHLVFITTDLGQLRAAAAKYIELSVPSAETKAEMRRLVSGFSTDEYLIPDRDFYTEEKCQKPAETIEALTAERDELRERTNRIIKRLGDALLECRKLIINGHSDDPAGDIAEIDKALYEAGAREGEFLHPQCTYPDNDEPLTPDDQAMIDQAWERHKAAKPSDERARLQSEIQADLLAALKLLVLDLADYPAAERPVHAVDNAIAVISRAESLCPTPNGDE